MPFPRTIAALARLALVAGLLLSALPAFSIEENQPLHYSADRQVWNRKENRVELFGHASVRQPGESLTADYIELEMNARTIHAKGNCVYIASDTIINGEEMHFNMDSRTGSIVAGRVSNEAFSLAGERINKLGDRRFQTHWGEYSTCRDCPQSWAFEAEDVDMQVEGYAYLKNVTMKVKDASAVWFPYLIVPIKTQRQTGLLFPRISVNDQNGAMVVLPFFWAISRSADMTFGLGQYTARGPRFEWQGRYAYSPTSNGTANFFYLRDQSKDFLSINHPNRWAVDIAQTHDLPFGIEQKLRLIDVSDNLYPTFVGDVPGSGEAVIESDLILSYRSPDISAYGAARRFRNLLNTNPDPVARVVEFDPRTVQALPTAAVTTNDRFLFGTNIAAGLTLGVTNFTRAAGPFDYDSSRVPFGVNPGTAGPPFLPGTDPVREATRVSLTPTMYTTLRPFDVLSLTPSLRYYSYFYSFHQSMPNLNRGYLLFQTDLTTQFERIFETQDPDIPRIKHLIRPMLTYSWIPHVREDRDHPFLQQIRQRAGYNFDNYDIVPLDSSPSNINYFVPLGNSLSYGVATQLVRRRGAVGNEAPWYQRSVELTAGQAINFRRSEERASRLFSTMNFQFDQLAANAEYSYTPYIPTIRHIFSANASYVFERSVRQKILAFDRSLGFGYSYNKIDCREYNCGTSNLTGTLTFSLSDYVLPSFTTSFDLNTHRFFSNALNVHFQSPSRCWRFTIGVTRHITTGPGLPVDFSLNLTGSGFGGVGELAGQVQSK